MRLRDEFLPASWSEFGHALASLLVFAMLMAGAAVAPVFAPELSAARDTVLDFLGNLP